MTDPHNAPEDRYRGFTITYDPSPVGDGSGCWRFVHDDYDERDSSDPRFAFARTLREAYTAIDEILDGIEDAERARASSPPDTTYSGTEADLRADLYEERDAFWPGRERRK